VTTTCKKKQKSKFFTFCLFCPYLQITHTKRFFSKASIWCVFRNLYIFRFFTFSLCGVKLYLISKKIIYTTVTTTCKKKTKSYFLTFCLFCPYLTINHKKWFWQKLQHSVFVKHVYFCFFKFFFMWWEIIFNFRKKHLPNCDKYIKKNKKNNFFTFC
jgi:hypothetical protein